MQRLPFDEYKRPLVRSSKCGIKFHPGCMHYNQWVRNYSELDSPNARAGRFSLGYNPYLFALYDYTKSKRT